LGHLACKLSYVKWDVEVDGDFTLFTRWCHSSGKGNVELYAKLVYVLKRGVVNCTGNGGILKYVHQKTESCSAAGNGLTSDDWLDDDDDDDELLSSELNSLDSSASSPKKPKMC